MIKQHPKEILLSAFARMAEQAPFYIFTAFVFSYGTGTLHVSRDFLLTAVLAASVLSFVSIPLFGHLSDRIGRKNMYMIGAVVTGVFGFIYFAMLDTGSEPIIFFAIILSLIPHDMMYGPQAALIAESFTGRLRYSGASLGYQLASDHRRRPGAADRDLAVRHLSFGDRDRGLYRGLRRHHPDRDRADDRLHRQGHLGRISEGGDRGRRRDPSLKPAKRELDQSSRLICSSVTTRSIFSVLLLMR